VIFDLIVSIYIYIGKIVGEVDFIAFIFIEIFIKENFCLVIEIIIFFFSSQMQIRTYTMSGPIKVVKTKLFIGNLDPGTQPGMLKIKYILFFQELFIYLFRGIK